MLRVLGRINCFSLWNTWNLIRWFDPVPLSVKNLDGNLVLWAHIWTIEILSTDNAKIWNYRIRLHYVVTLLVDHGSKNKRLTLTETDGRQIRNMYLRGMISSTSYALHLNYKVAILPIPPIQRLFNPACIPNIKTQTCILFAKKEI